MKVPVAVVGSVLALLVLGAASRSLQQSPEAPDWSAASAADLANLVELLKEALQDNDIELASLLQEAATYNKHRFLVVPFPENGTEAGENMTRYNPGSGWQWNMPEGFNYRFTPDTTIDILSDDRVNKAYDSDAVIGVLEANDKVSWFDTIANYRELKDNFKYIFFDREVKTSQLGSQGTGTSAVDTSTNISPDIGSLVNYDQALMADYSAAISQLGQTVAGLPAIVPTDTDWDSKWDTRMVRGDYTLDDAFPMQGQGTVVAVLDTGCVMNHEDLQPNLWVNEAELNGLPGVDDDGNGYVDDVHGYNFVNNTGDVTDDNGHGSHVAGIIGAVVNNTFGVMGLASGTKIMCVKFMDSTGAGFQSAAIMGMSYAIQMNATVQNHSWGSPSTSTALQNIAVLSGRMGQVLAAAAGNEGTNIDLTPTYPAAFADPKVYDEVSMYVISVGASTAEDGRASFSNFGVDTVDFSAPGVDILSLSNVPSGTAVKSGTSMATPIVSAAAAIILAIIHIRLESIGLPDLLTAADKVWATKQILMQTVDPVSGLTGSSRTGGRMNLFSAIQLAVTGDNSTITKVPVTTVGLEGLAWWIILIIAVAVAVAILVAAFVVYKCMSPKAHAKPEANRESQPVYNHH